VTGVTLLGAPWDGSSSFQRGAAGAPPLIRAALASASSNLWNERGDDLAAEGVLSDAGDLELPADAAAAREAIEHAARAIVASGRRPIVLGGDHSITYPTLRAFSGRAEPVTVLHLDAHADLYDQFGGDRFSHACPFARIMEERLAGRLIQVGVRTLNAHQRSQAAKFGVEILGGDRWRDAMPLMARLRGALYVSIDLDVLEPMLAPGVSHPEPGGLTVRDVLEILAAIRVPVVGADIVEYNPANDLRDLTARVAAKLLKELVGLLRR
jgi:agmatinase